jgi:hypothetical protein
MLNAHSDKIKWNSSQQRTRTEEIPLFGTGEKTKASRIQQLLVSMQFLPPSIFVSFPIFFELESY